MQLRTLALVIIVVATLARQAAAVDPTLVEFVNRRAAACTASSQVNFETPDQWEPLRRQWRGDLQKMLGLSPWPERGDLRATVTGVIERSGIAVEKLHFQSVPGLYVTANFYRPLDVREPLPTILYLCGHARVVENGVSFGNKVGYQHHGAWFARNGYCCLTIDTVQLGEVEGIHHGTYREGMWWWISRGYTPAGVEAWNALRALDYLETRPEVDRGRIGVTGRSGGGAYSWWVAALDDRPACLAPVAGITDLQNHVVDGCIEGHCDCMYMVNRLGWDFGKVACLVAPRPCLLGNTDRDPIFPLDGVVRIHSQLRQVYNRLKAEEKLGLAISEGPHKDGQELQLAAFRWFNHWLRGIDEPVTILAEKLFVPAELKVFETLPDDAINGTIHETFVPAAATSDAPRDLESWNALRQHWLQRLRAESFSSWPEEGAPLEVKETAQSDVDADRRVLEFTSERGIRLAITVVGIDHAAADAPIVLHVIGDDRRTYLDRTVEHVPSGEVWAFVAPRGCDRVWSEEDPKVRTHLPRRFVLVGTTLDEGRVWDIRRAVSALQESVGKSRPITVAARGAAAGLALYASAFSPNAPALLLEHPPASHRTGPTFMNVLRVLDMPQALALAFPQAVTIRTADPASFSWAAEVAKLHPAESTLRFVQVPSENVPPQASEP
jgi:hypothetical protein